MTKLELETAVICVIFAPYNIVSERSVSTEFTIKPFLSRVYIRNDFDVRVDIGICKPEI